MSDKGSDTQGGISLPKGGGALRGIGETFQPNLFSGTSNHTIPVALSPGRNGFGPALAVQYSSGNGNGPFGLGWQLSLPRITRKTEKGLPRYDDSDVFVLSGAEDLVRCRRRVVDAGGEVSWVLEEPVHRLSHTVQRFRPRTEGLFARIERWQHDTTQDVHWRSITKDNITSVFGATPAARIGDPEDARRVHEWLLQETFDAYGNHVLYEYAKDEPNAAPDNIFERNRVTTQRYIRRICYGNLPDPLVDEEGDPLTYPDGTAVGCERAGRRYGFEVIFDYGDWDVPTRDPHPQPPPVEQQELFGPDPAASSAPNAVPVRQDPFSTFNARFEVRTLRRCRRVLMFHHFAELGSPALVRSTDFSYEHDADTLLSLLSAVTVTGYRRDAVRGYISASMPPVTFEYSLFRPHEQRYQSLAAQGDDLPPVGLNAPDLALVDLFGDGLPDVLQSGTAGLRYWRNLGGGRLDRPRSLPQIPAAIALGAPGVGFGDMGGDGQLDLLVHAGPMPGFFETTAEETWQTFKPYTAFPSFDLADPNVRLVDLTGDGLSDALSSRGDRLLWFQCLGEKGFAAPEHIVGTPDPEVFPNVFFNDPAGRVRLARVSGGALNDIVLVQDGRIDYWPNLGFGRFGKRVTMSNAPRLGADFDPKRLFLVDLNGTGCADLVYVEPNRVHFWFNRSGNEWSEQQTIFGTPPVNDLDSVQVADVFGTGTAALLWSYRYAAQPGSNYKALDFCGGVKPYVLIEMANNLGTTTRVSYVPSTRHFAEDLANGTPWITKLPFPVQVLDRVEIVDHISRTKLVSTYKYHHGYFDGREREFRGFGRVDQFDTETFEDFTGSSLHGGDLTFDNGSAAYHAAPVETRTWFHTGVYFDEDSSAQVAGAFDYRELTNRFRAEFYAADAEAVPIGEHLVETGATPHEAYRALRGSVLRTEIYARDGGPRAAHPYIVAENRYRVVQLQAAAGADRAVYLNHPSESLRYDYERNPADPRVSQSLTLQADLFGNALKTLAIAYGRRQPDAALPTQADRNRQAVTLIVYTQNRYTNAVDDPAGDPDNYRLPLPAETRAYELTGFTPTDLLRQFTLEEWTRNDFARLEAAAELAYEETAAAGLEQKRLIEHTCTRYRADDLSDLLTVGTLESLALPGESYRLAFTPGLLSQIFGERVNDSMLAADGGYVHSEAGDLDWWLPSGRVFYSPDAADAPAAERAFAQQHFFLPHRRHDAFGNATLVDYDPYDILLEQTIDPMGNRVGAEQDYRVLKPFRVTDPNGNRVEAAFDALGMLAGTAVMGKATQTQGDTLSAFVADLTAQQREDFLADPLQDASALLGQATTRIIYDLDRYRATQQPAFAALLARETHVSDVPVSGESKIKVELAYSDGFGREIQKKLRAEPGPLAGGGPEVDPRWVGSGWVIFNNKGKPVRQYEPFFDGTHEFRFANSVGVSSTLLYDPAERVVATLHPNRTWEKIVLQPWRQESWDVNDTALVSDPATDPDVGEFFRRLPQAEYLPTWHAQRTGGALGPDEQAAAISTAVHAATPSIAYADALGQTFLTTVHNRFERSGVIVEEHYATHVVLDIEGNRRALIDADDRVVMRFDYDMLGATLHQASMEAGERWMLEDVAGQVIHTWDSRGHQFSTTYDALRRPTHRLLREETGDQHLIAHTVYGETLPNPEAENLRGKMVRMFDQAGVLTADRYDFKGNVLVRRRQLARDYRTTLDWQADPALETDVFTSAIAYDALNRPRSITYPDDSVYRPMLNAAGLLARVDVRLRGSPTATQFVNRIDYDAKGQRVLVELGNGASTHYEYDPLTFRLSRLSTVRGTQRLQDLSYTYDPAGNATHIRDEAQQTVYFGNQAVGPHTRYSYDALYRLIVAEGREHIGQVAAPATTWDDRFRVRLPHPGDGQAMRRYTERYEYDAAGNLLELMHSAANGDWTRRYTYDEPSLLEPGKRSNRLSSTRVGAGPAEHHGYDAHGNTQTLPHLARMEWNFVDELRSVDLGGGGTAHYVYDGAGLRVRKVVERTDTRIEERLYLGEIEVYRERQNGTVTLERQTLHVLDDLQRIASVETRTQGTDDAPAQSIRYAFHNHLGSATLELDGAAQIISYEEYYPYGSTSYQAVRSQTEVAKRYRFTGVERDEESGLNYHEARYYAPWLGRWLSCDPAGFVDGLNLYEMANCNPLRFIDPGGEDNTETIHVSPAVKEYLDKYNVKYATEVKFELLDDKGKVVTTGRFDVLFRDPRPRANGQLVIPELKGKNIDKLHANQHIYTPILETKGGTIRITSYKTSDLNLRKGDVVKLTKENYLRVGVSNLSDFADALAEVTGGKKITHTYRGQGGEVKFFTNQADFDKFLQSKGIDTKNGPRTQSKKKSSSSQGSSGSASSGGGDGGSGGIKMTNLVKDVGKGATATVVAKLLTEGELPSPQEVVISAVPLGDVATAKNHDETVIPIILYFAGWKVTLAVGAAVVIYAGAKEYVWAIKQEPLNAIPGVGVRLGGTLHSNKGYGALLCYPGKPGCGKR